MCALGIWMLVNNKSYFTLLMAISEILFCSCPNSDDFTSILQSLFKIYGMAMNDFIDSYCSIVIKNITLELLVDYFTFVYRYRDIEKLRLFLRNQPSESTETFTSTFFYFFLFFNPATHHFRINVFFADTSDNVIVYFPLVIVGSSPHWQHFPFFTSWHQISHAENYMM